MISDLVECPLLRASMNANTIEEFFLYPGVEPEILRAAEYIEGKHGRVFSLRSVSPAVRSKWHRGMLFADCVSIAREHPGESVADMATGKIKLEDPDWDIAAFCCSYLDVVYGDGYPWESYAELGTNVRFILERVYDS